jgi:hypothetical protein
MDRLRHHDATPEDLVASEASDSLVSLYLGLCAEAAGGRRAPGAAELEAAQVLGTTTREQYRAALRQLWVDRQLAERTQEIAALKADNAALRAQATQIRAQIAAEQAGRHAALAQQANAHSALADLRLQQYLDMERHARAVEAVLERQRLRVLLLRILRFGRNALQRVAGENAQR